MNKDKILEGDYSFIADFFAGKAKDEKNGAFLDKVSSWPVNSQRFMADLSSMFIEKDIYDAFKDNEAVVQKIREMLSSRNVADNDIELVLAFFNLKQPEDLNKK